MRRVVVATVLPAVAALAVLATGQSCSSFGTTPEGAAASDGATPGDDGAPLDAPALDATALDAGACPAPGTLITLDFDSDPFPPSGFKLDVVDGGSVVRSPNAGVGGSGALQSDLLVPDASDGPTAKIYRQFKVAPAEIELSYDFTAPTAAGLYVSAGCELSFHTAASDQIRTKLLTRTYDLSGPLLQAESSGDAAVPLTEAVAATPGQFHHMTMRVVIDPTGTSLQAHVVLDGVAKDIPSFPLVVDPSAVTLTCGAYADSVAANITVLVDNVRFAICRTRP